MTEDLQTALNAPTIAHLDLTAVDFREHKADFSGKTLIDVDFSGNNTLANISFYKAQITGCKFENAVIENADFRYAKITDTTFKKACFKQTDFHQTAFSGITVFQDSKFRLCSLSYLSFADYCITRHNLPKKMFKPLLIQEDKTAYRQLLNRMKDKNEITQSQIDEALKSRHREAARIYRQFSAMWESRGHNRDGEWAYVESKKKELLRLLCETKKSQCVKENKCPQNEQCRSESKTVNLIKALFNIISGVFLGYGVRWINVFFTFALVTLLYAKIYHSTGETGGLSQSLITSLGFTIGIGERPPIENMPLYTATMTQTAISIFLLSVFGFMVANKIRKS